MGKWRRLPRVILFLPFLLDSCAEEYDRCPNLGVERWVEELRGNPRDANAAECLLGELNRSKPEAICSEDRNANGSPAATEVLGLAKSRIQNAPNEKPPSGFGEPYGETYTEKFLNRIASSCPELESDARFARVMFKVGQAVAPVSDLAGLKSIFTGKAGGLDINKIIGPVIGIISPDTPCADKGIARCGKDVSEAVAAMGDSIHENHTLDETVVTVGTTAVDIGGTYNEPALRMIAAAGDLIAFAFHFLGAHTDINAFLSDWAGVEWKFDTAGQALATFDSIDEVLLSCTGGLQSSDQHLEVGRESLAGAIQWLVGNSGGKGELLRSAENQTAEGLGIRIIDNGDYRLGACDWIQFNLGFSDDLLEDYYSTTPATGCLGDVAPRAFQLPRVTSGGVHIDYDRLFEVLARLLRKLAQSTQDKTVAVTFDDINPLLGAFDKKAIPPVAAFYPGVLFHDGFSILKPHTVQQVVEIKEKFVSRRRVVLEAEVNPDAPRCPEGKNQKGQYVCKNSKGDKDYSADIRFGDSDHFGGTLARDDLSINEKLLDEHKAKPDTFYRKDQGGGFLPYVNLYYPDLKGFILVDEGMITDLTNPSIPVCERKPGTTVTGRLVPTDNRFVNAIFNYFLIAAKVCGNKTLSSVEESVFACGDADLGQSLNCAGDFDFGCSRGFNLACDQDFDLDLDFNCDAGDFVPSCDASDFDFGDLSCRVVLPVRARRGVGRFATLLINCGIFLSPLLLWPLVRRRKR